MMTRKLLLISSLAIAGVFASVPALAQAPTQGGPGGQAQAQAPTQGIDVATAKRMVAAAEAAATAANAHVAISVVDANGDLVYFERMDGASHGAVTSSQGKARAAILFGLSSKEVQDAMDMGKPITVTLTPPVAGAADLNIHQGAVPILKDGKVIAAIGCGGSASANDEKFAQAGLAAISPK